MSWLRKPSKAIGAHWLAAAGLLATLTLAAVVWCMSLPHVASHNVASLRKAAS